MILPLGLITVRYRSRLPPADILTDAISRFSRSTPGRVQTFRHCVAPPRSSLIGFRVLLLPFYVFDICMFVDNKKTCHLVRDDR